MSAIIEHSGQALISRSTSSLRMNSTNLSRLILSKSAPKIRPISSFTTRSVIPSAPVAQPTRQIPIIHREIGNTRMIEYWYKDSICLLTKDYAIIPLKSIPGDGSVVLKAVYSFKDIQMPDPDISVLGPFSQHKPTIQMEHLSVLDAKVVQESQVAEAVEAEADGGKAFIAEIRGAGCKKCTACVGKNVASMRRN